MTIFKVKDKNGLTFYSTCKKEETGAFNELAKEEEFEILNSVVVTGLTKEFLDFNGLVERQEICNLLSFRYSRDTEIHKTVLTNPEMLRFSSLAKVLDLIVEDCFPISKKTYDYIRSLEIKVNKMEFEIINLNKSQNNCTSEVKTESTNHTKTETKSDSASIPVVDYKHAKFNMVKLILEDLLTSLSEIPNNTKESIENIIETIARKAREDLKDENIPQEMEDNIIIMAKDILNKIYEKKVI